VRTRGTSHPRIRLAALTAFALVGSVSLVAALGNCVYFMMQPPEDSAFSELQVQGDSVKTGRVVPAVVDYRRTRPHIAINGGG
jgi:hypothetical protein